MSKRPLFPDLPRPWVFAHRGYSSRHVENTLSAFTAARDAGASGVELDVQMCSTGEVVVFHDYTTDRMTGESGRVDSSSWKDLSQLSLRGEEKIPLLAHVFDALGRDQHYDIEIKHKHKGGTGLEGALLSIIESRGLADRCVISSFNPYAVREFRRISNSIPVAVIYSPDKEVPWILRNGGGKHIAHADAIKPRHSEYRGWHSIRNRLLGYPALPWTVDDPTEALRVIKAGAAGVITNDPATILSTFKHAE